MPFLCLQTAAIPDGVLQITDMTPNESQRSELQGDGQTRYVNRVQNDIVVDSLANQVRTVLNVGGCQGLAAYIIDNVDAGGGAGGAAATAAQANTAAAAIIAIMDAGTVCGETQINLALTNAGIGGGTTIDGGGSEGHVTEVLGILSGRGYVVPAGSEVQVANAKVSRRGTFTPQRTSQASTGGPNRPAPVIAIDLEDKGIRRQVLSTSLLASAGGGEINGFEIAQTIHAMSVINGNDGNMQVIDKAGNPMRTVAPPFARAKLAKNRLTATTNQTILVLYADDGTVLT